MDTKLTVRVEKNLIENAKRYARNHHTTLTDLISAYLQQIPEAQDFLKDAPLVRRLSGTLSAEISTADYKKHLDEKYGG